MFARLKGARANNIIGEILMIVVGINIALWFEGKFEDLREVRQEQQYLAGLRDDLQTDIASLEALIASCDVKISKLAQIIPRIDALPELASQEQAAALFEASSYGFFYPSDFTYQSMQESGDFHLLQDEETKRNILRLMRRYRQIDDLQSNFMQAMDSEYIPLMMASYDLVENRITDAALVENQAFRNFFVFTVQDTDGRRDAYQNALELASALLVQIETQLEEGAG